MSCNPCSQITPPATEPLASQIENFAGLMFGALERTNTNGVWTWQTPCDLEAGLENNPRDDGEGLVCYALRLLASGVAGYQGDQGPAGTPGVDGVNAVSAALGSTLLPANPGSTITLPVAVNAALAPGLYVFLPGAGYFEVLANSGGSAVFSLVKRIGTPGDTIALGCKIIPAGPTGVGATGATGPQGPKGDTGDDGESATAVYGQWNTQGGSDQLAGVVYADVDFGGGRVAEMLLPEAGAYLVTFTARATAAAGVANTDWLSLRLFDTHAPPSGLVVPGSEIRVSTPVESGYASLSAQTIYGVAGPHTLALQAYASVASKISVQAGQVVMSYVKLA